MRNYTLQRSSSGGLSQRIFVVPLLASLKTRASLLTHICGADPKAIYGRGDCGSSLPVIDQHCSETLTGGVLWCKAAVSRGHTFWYGSHSSTRTGSSSCIDAHANPLQPKPTIALASMSSDRGKFALIRNGTRKFRPSFQTVTSILSNSQHVTQRPLQRNLR